MEQGVLQEEAAGKDGQPGRLGQDENIVVFEKRPEIRRRGGLVPRKAMVEERVAADQRLVRRGL